MPWRADARTGTCDLISCLAGMTDASERHQAWLTSFDTVLQNHTQTTLFGIRHKFS
jgi:hypothetical protein